MTPAECIQKYVENVHLQYCCALEDFVKLLGATEENVREYMLVESANSRVRGVYHHATLVGTIQVVNSDHQIYIVCQDMRHATD